jgi:hypothetical protein
MMSLQAGKAKFYLRVNNNAASAWVFSTTFVNDDSWHHVAVVKDTSNDLIRLYVDGTQEASQEFTDGETSNDHVLGVGGEHWDRYFNGLVDEIRISDIARYTTTSFTPQTTAFSTDGNTVGLWHIDEGVGTTANDETANDNDGTISGPVWAGPTWVDGKNGGTALDFDGTDDYVSVPDSGSLDITGEITLEGWIKPSAVYTGGDWKYDDIIVAKRMAYYLRIDENGKLAFYGYGLSPGGWITGSDMSSYINTWVHVAATYDGATVKLYIDGQEDTSASHTGSIQTSSHPLTIGWVNYNRFFDGAIDEVRIWDRALKPCEVQLAMDGQLEILLDAGIVIYTSSVHDVEIGVAETILIVPDDRSITIDNDVDVVIHRVTPRKKNGGEATIEVTNKHCYSIDVTVLSAPSRAKTIHLWVYLSNGEHVPVNLHIGH